MLIFKSISPLQHFLQDTRASQLGIGFVPTMGALHQGHLELIRHSLSKNAVTVCSIFVNPTQFNNAKDLEKYPRTVTDDMEMLELAGCDILFLPSVEEIYPPSLNIRADFDFGQLDKVMEGQFRPGHFKGMAQVVNRLLDIVQPTNLYMGQKDFQQFTIVSNMLKQIQSATNLRVVPTIREADGLAMSSRNRRLSEQERLWAAQIYAALAAAKAKIFTHDIAQIQAEAIKHLANIPTAKVEYFEIADAETLQPIQSVEQANSIVACTAVFIGEIRLIDNILLK